VKTNLPVCLFLLNEELTLMFCFVVGTMLFEYVRLFTPLVFLMGVDGKGNGAAVYHDIFRVLGKKYST